MKNFHDLFAHELRDIYSAEMQLVKWLPEFVKASHAKELKEAFRSHHEETKKHVTRLEKIAHQLKIDLKTGRECEAMKTFLNEAQKVMKADYPPEVRDAALVSCAQRIEHYEIALYGTLKSFAKHLELKEVEKLLNETSKEEGHADKKLSEIAIGTTFSSGINKQALRKSA